MHTLPIRNAGALLAMAVLAACFPAPRVQPPPTVNFAAHVDHRGLVVDRMHGNEQGRVLSGGTLPFSGGPQLVLSQDGTTTAAVWLGNSQEIVRATSDPRAAVLGEVDARVDNRGAVRLTVRSAEGQIFQIGRFRRIDGRIRPETIGEPAAMTLDARGVYVADVRDAASTPVGWLRVRVGPRGATITQTYEGDLPVGLNGPLAVAAVAKVESAVSAMRQYAVDPYLGN